MQFSRKKSPVAKAVVVITGGARGIGAKTAEVFSAAGATVWIGDVDADVAATTAATLRHCRGAHLDVTDRSSWDRFVAEVLDTERRIGLRAVIPTMVGQGAGHIVNVASMAGMIPIPGW